MTAIGNGPAELGIRPLSARSVLLSTLLGVDPPVLTTRRLVATARLLGVEEGTARVALSRLVAAGEVVTEDGRHRLTGRLLERQRRQLAGRHPATGPWDGDWHLAVVTETRRVPRDRAALRARLAGARLAEWREGVWTRPDNLPAPPLPPPQAGHVSWLVARPDDRPEDLARRLWDLDGWADVARGLLGHLAATESALAAGDATALAPGFMVSAAVLRHLTADPLLPPALLPPSWPGPELRDRYEAWDASFQAGLAAHHRAEA